MSSDFDFSEGKILNYTLVRETGQRRRRLTLEGPNESWDKDSLTTKFQRPSRKAEERVDIR
jgi:hypothetical protein